jgi:CBS domain containing-hemolysin-like protein
MDDFFSWMTGGKLATVIALVLANGFFVAAEFSLVALRRSRVEELIAEGHYLARTLERAVKNLDAFLAACQLGITMSSIGLGWIGEPFLAALIEPALRFLPESWAFIGAHAIAVAIAFTIITALHIVLGELAPKSLALQRTEATALAVVSPLEWYLRLFRPVIAPLNNLGNLVLRLLGLRPAGGEELVHSPEELKFLVTASREAGLLSEAEEEMVEEVLRLRDRRVGALMTPRTEIVWIDLDDSPDENRRKMMESGRSRFPVCQGGLDNVLGVVFAKDLLARILAGEPLDLKSSVRDLLFVPESVRALKVLELFKQSGTDSAMVTDEYGGIQGLITLKDILEAIVGEIPSADEPPDPQVVRRADGSWLLDGMLPVDEVTEVLSMAGPPPEEGAYHTLGGFVMAHLGRIPSTGDRFEWGGLQFEVVDMDGHRVDKVLVTPEPPTPPDSTKIA